ncbi:hypothetical protein P7C73_g3242, partial [Tremellales sp. Uapishka_1]
MRTRTIIPLFTFLGSIINAQEHQLKLPVPQRPLEWNDVNFLSTSDTHGWLLGHQHATWPEPNYSGDFGTYASFATHMRSIAESKGVDLLLVDAGDHHDGSGLVSQSPEGAAKADEIFSMLEYDILALGNHELYKYKDAKLLYDNRGKWKGRLLTSNVNITLEEDGVKVSKPIGDRYAKFKTRMGKKVTAFGVLFNFRANDPRTTVQSPTLMAKEPWFLETIAEAPDFFVLAGHMAARGESAEWDAIFSAIRAVHPLVPIFIFGGHTHVRDCMQMDERSISVVPGRYLETIAFTSSNLPDKGDDKALDLSRRYLDANDQSYKYHSGRDEDFPTALGRNITLELLRLSSQLEISTPLGKAPHDLFLARFPFGHPRSILTEFAEKVIPATIHEKGRSSEKRILISNSGGQRYDLFQGGFDRNDELTVSPFTSAFLYVTLPLALARNITERLNEAGISKIRPASPFSTSQDDVEKHVEQVYNRYLASSYDSYLQTALVDQEDDQLHFGKENRALTLGHVTYDACGVNGRDGDDIPHIPVPFSSDIPDFISSVLPAGLQDDEDIDVAFMDFFLDDFVAAVNHLDPSRKLTADDPVSYGAGREVNIVWGLYAKKYWQK